MTPADQKRLRDHFWRAYEDARRRLHMAQHEHELIAAGNDAASAFSGWIVAHNPNCPHCGAALQAEGCK